MIIFGIIWWVIKAWFLVFTYAGAVVGFIIGLGLAVSLIAFGIEWLRDRWNRPLVKRPRNILPIYKEDKEDK